MIWPLSFSIRVSWIVAMLAISLPGCSEDEGARGLPLGASCAGLDDSSCGSRLCLRMDSATAYCTRPCDVAGQDCPPGYICRTTSNPRGEHCVMRGASCNDDSDCPSGHRCDTSPGPGEGICYIAVSRGLCAPCDSDLQCPEGGACLEVTDTGERFCTVPCDNACPDGYSCMEPEGLSPQCVPDRLTCGEGRSICRPCRGHAECGGFGDLCVENFVSGERFCALACQGQEGEADHEQCPDDFSCLDLSGEGGGPWQCLPNTASCQGYCDAEPGDIVGAEAQCGFGRMCEEETNTCLDADDGRLCAPCADDDDCRRLPGSSGNLCIANRLTNERFCARPCGDGASECTVGFSCVEIDAAGEPQLQCVPSRGSCRGGTGLLGDDCGVGGADDCVTGICLDFGAVAACSARCAIDEDCAGGGDSYRCCWLSPDRTEFDCERSVVDEGVCAPVGGSFGDDCSPGRAPCQSGLCLDIGTARLCTSRCEASECCPTGFVCRTGTSTALDSDEISICFPAGGGQLGSDCTFGPAACESRLCIRRGGVGTDICTIPCPESGDCPEDWVCDPHAGTVDGGTIPVCVPPELRP